jgi:DNA modification methylase
LDTVHPNQKPVAALRPILNTYVPAGGTVLDPFMGSGSTLRAAKDLGLKAIGIEIEECYCRVAANRMAQEVLFT